MRNFTLACLLGTCALFAQSPDANISGTVRDPQGALVIGAQVTAKNVATDVSTNATTNDAGFYSIRNLQIGNYVISTTMPGFRRYERKGVTLSTGASVELDVTLEVGQVSETVSVTATTQQLETRTSDVSQLVDTKTVEDVPLGDRRTMNLVNLLPAAVFVAYDSGAKPNFSLAGGRTQSQNFFIDGGTGQNMRLGVGQIDTDPPVETVAEVKVLSNNYAAEYGGSAGGVIIATTKSGTNKLKGTLFEYLRNEKLDAGNFFAPTQNGEKVRAPLRYNVFGGTVGGPVVIPKLYNGKDKTFFFFAYEGQQRSEGQVRTLTVPSELEKAGNFSQTRTAAGALVPVYDPATTRVEAGRTVRDLFPGNIIPANRLDAVAKNLVTFYPVANRPPDNASGANNFRGNYATILNRNNFTAKVDHQVTANDRISVRYLYNSDDSDNTSVFPKEAGDTLATTIRHQNFTYGSWTKVITPEIINEVRFTYGDRVNWARSYGLGMPWATTLGLKGVPDGAFPAIVTTGFTNLGSTAQERQQFPIRQWQFIDNFSIVKGKHTMKFGFEMRPSYNFEINRPLAAGQWNFSPLGTGIPGTASSGFGLATMMLGLPQSVTLRETESLDRKSNYLAAFAQTDWNVHKDLTLNLGVRWETDTPITDKDQRMNGFDQKQINPVSGTPGVVKFMGQNGFRTDPYDTDWINFGPRVGFAWKPLGSSKTVIRGGWGMFFAHPFDRGAPNSASLGFEQSYSSSSPDNGITFPVTLASGVPASGLTKPPLNDSFGAVPVGAAVTTAVTFFETSRKTGYSMQHNFNIQRELPGGLLVEVGYLANISHRLASANLSLNQIPNERMGPGTSQRDRPFPQFSGVTLIAPGLGDSAYHAGIVRVQKRFAAGLSFNFNYTWSKFLNNTDEGGSALGAEGNPYSNFYNRRADWGPSENDIPHRISFSAVYDLPFGTGKKWLNKNKAKWVLGDWGVSTVTTLQSGAVFTVTTQVDSTNAFSAGALRADVLRNPNLETEERSLARWFDTSAFAQPAAYRYGNQGVNLLRGDGLVNIDFSLLRNFPIGEQRKLQFRAESFNVTNTPTFGIPGRVFGGPGFGVVGTASPGRRLQLGLRLVW